MYLIEINAETGELVAIGGEKSEIHVSGDVRVLTQVQRSYQDRVHKLALLAIFLIIGKVDNFGDTPLRPRSRGWRGDSLRG